MNLEQFAQRTDYDLLTRQKQTILEMLDPDQMHFDIPDRMTHLEGLLNFLDAFQDAAIESGLPEAKVFPLVV